MNLTLFDIMKSLQDFRENIIIGHRDEKYIVNRYYETLIRNKPFKYILCGEIAELFKVKVEVKYKFNQVKRIFIWNGYMIDQFNYHFGEEYILAALQNKSQTLQKYENVISFDDNQKGTHALLEIIIENRKYIIDPTVGIIYSRNIEELLLYQNAYLDYQFMNQYEYILKSIHMCRPYMNIYTTKSYWKSIKSWNYYNKPFVHKKTASKYIQYFKY